MIKPGWWYFARQALQRVLLRPFKIGLLVHDDSDSCFASAQYIAKTLLSAQLEPVDG
jgi:hypothetical protein